MIYIYNNKTTEYNYTSQCLNLNIQLLCLFQRKIDLARAHYLQLLFRYTKTMGSGSSRLNATLHRVLKTVKDFAEQMRSQVVVSVKH